MKRSAVTARLVEQTSTIEFGEYRFMNNRMKMFDVVERLAASRLPDV
jgi:hypothetical protein